MSKSMTRRRLVSDTWTLSPDPGQKGVDKSATSNTG